MPARLLAVALAGLFGLPLSAADKDKEVAKEELQKLSEFVGRWTTSGEGKVDGKK